VTACSNAVTKADLPQLRRLGSHAKIKSKWTYDGGESFKAVVDIDPVRSAAGRRPRGPLAGSLHPDGSTSGTAEWRSSAGGCSAVTCYLG
jgi:hypothetical protein